MVIKSLTITEDAYNRLKAMKMGNESFSEAIVRISNNKVGAAAKFFGAFKGTDTEAIIDLLNGTDRGRHVQLIIGTKTCAITTISINEVLIGAKGKQRPIA